MATRRTRHPTAERERREREAYEAEQRRKEDEPAVLVGGSLYYKDPYTGQAVMGDRLLTVGEVAAMMRVSDMTVVRLIQSGRLAALFVGENYRIRESDLDRYRGQKEREGL